VWPTLRMVRRNRTHHQANLDAGNTEIRTARPDDFFPTLKLDEGVLDLLRLLLLVLEPSNTELVM